MKTYFGLAIAIFLILAVPYPARAGDVPAEKGIAAVLDDWHAAAAAADEERYFSHFASGAVFLGTDATERWTVDEFRRYAHPYFAKGKAWSFRAVTRHISPFPRRRRRLV